MACDEAVVRITQAPRAYAACLAGLAARGLAYRKEALSLGAWQRRSELVQRVHRILSNRRGLSPVTARVLLGAFGCSLLAGTIELARCPKLVAFVPATQASDRAPAGFGPKDGGADVGDAVYPTDPARARLTAGARMVQTRAEIPSASVVKPTAGRARWKGGVEGELRAASSEPGATPHLSRAIAAHKRVPSSAEAAQQLIVFTAFEQIETTTTQSRKPIADYETQPANDASTAPKAIDEAAPAKSDAQPADSRSSSGTERRTTVTQLILRITPSSSKSTHPAAIPFGDGWFVIQL